MSHYIERSSKGWNCMSGKRYSVERFAYIFKTAVKFKKTTGEYPLPSHLSDIALVSFKVAKKQLYLYQATVSLCTNLGDIYILWKGFLETIID